MTGHELTAVIPVHNEAEAVAAVVTSWVEELGRLNIDYVVRVYDDGSRDNTAAKVDDLIRSFPSVQLIHHERRGHGPTILRGYREADGNWILQVDGDGEVRPTEFASFWRQRGTYDLIVGSRQGRQTPMVRRMITRLAKLVVLLAFGRSLRDVNCPYRLMRRERFEPFFSLLPADTFAPNVALTAMASASGMRVLEVPVECHARTSGETSLRRLHLLRAAFRSTWQTVLIAVRFWARRSRARAVERNRS